MDDTLNTPEEVVETTEEVASAAPNAEEVPGEDAVAEVPAE